MKKARALLLISVSVTVLTFLVAIPPASALPYTLLFDYASYSGGSATATGWVQLESTGTYFNNPTSDSGFSDEYVLADVLYPAVLGLSMTVSGATSGNGTFGMTDFTFLRWYTNGTSMNMAQELIGQTVHDNLLDEDHPFGQLGVAPLAGDFGFMGIGSAPTSTLDYFILETAGGDLMQLTSLRPDTPVPEPSTFILLAGGVFGLGLLRRKIFT